MGNVGFTSATSWAPQMYIGRETAPATRTVFQREATETRLSHPFTPLSICIWGSLCRHLRLTQGAELLSGCACSFLWLHRRAQKWMSSCVKWWAGGDCFHHVSFCINLKSLLVGCWCSAYNILSSPILRGITRKRSKWCSQMLPSH